MATVHSITTWIGYLRANDHEAAQPLWEEYFHRLVALARNYLRAGHASSYSEEDAALSAIQSAFRGIEAGRFPRLCDRDDLWLLLATITRNKAIDAYKKSLKQPSQASDAALEAAVDEQPTPELASQFADECQHLLAQLQDENLTNPKLRGKQLHQIALWKLDGCTNKAIAANLNCALRQVERRLAIIRTIWKRGDG